MIIRKVILTRLLGTSAASRHSATLADVLPGTVGTISAATTVPEYFSVTGDASVLAVRVVIADVGGGAVDDASVERSIDWQSIGVRLIETQHRSRW